MRTELVRILFAGAMAFAAALTAVADSPRVTEDWNSGWRFSKGEFTAAMSPSFDASAWRSVKLPHDWSTEEPLSADYASGTGYAAGGVGWYRKQFQLDPAWRGKVVAVEFDGVYDFSEVWVNGQFVGGRPYGYSSFQCDLTPYVKFGTNENVIAVRVDHSRFADSRWYTGSGIYRNVRLSATDPLRIEPWGTFVTTPAIHEHSATVRIETSIRNGSDKKRKFAVQSEILDDKDAVVASTRSSGAIAPRSNETVGRSVTLKEPRLWSIESPTLYRVRNRVFADDLLTDETVTSFGVRSIEFDPKNGFRLNGREVKLKGVCLHHDAGALGAAVPEKVLERRLRALKELGANAIRTSHNPPAPELLDLCDRIGLLVKDEAFDEFTPTKNKWISGWNSGQPSRFGYGEIFKEWGARDIQDMVRRDRNHPSIVLWSIGNEIDYANDPFSHPILGTGYLPNNPRAENLLECARPLVAAVKAMDSTRPVTAALANVAMSDAVGLPALLDVVGYNYQEQRYRSDHQKFPARIIFGSENHHDYGAWLAVKTNAFIAGQFLWTGIDYLGEAGRWPNHASRSGLLDMCGFKKPMAWFRQSLWSDKPMVYLCVGSQGNRGLTEHWNFAEGRTPTVMCYANCPEVTLELNGVEIGTKTSNQAVNGVLTWNVPYAPGTLRAIGRSGGKQLCEFALRTAGPAARLELLPDNRQLHADDKDICHVEFRIVDANGVQVPDADSEVKFEVTGPARVLGIGNGDWNNVESTRDNVERTFHGRGLMILQSTVDDGDVTVRATADGLEAGEVGLKCRK